MTPRDIPDERAMDDVPAALRAFEQWWESKGEKWRAHESSRKRGYQQVFAAGYETRHRDDLVARGMVVVNRLIEEDAPDAESPAREFGHRLCRENTHGDTHCWHWRGEPPTLRTRVMADCCWCGVMRTFEYSDAMSGAAPRSLSPRGSVHGAARDWLEEPTTHAPGTARTRSVEA